MTLAMSIGQVINVQRIFLLKCENEFKLLKEKPEYNK